MNSRLAAITLVFAGIFANIAFAAPLTWNADATVSLASPAATFTIIAGSTADSFQVNASSVVVTISSSTGGSFTLTSASTDLSVATTTGGGTVSSGCANGIASTTITQASGQDTYTITASTDTCIASSTPTSTPSGITVLIGGGSPPSSVATGPSGASAPANPPSPLPTSIAGMQALLNSLIAKLNVLVDELRSTAPSAGGSGGAGGFSHNFRTDLSYRERSSEVRFLQEFLAEDKTLYPQGEITGYFGPLTLRAVERFQEKFGIAARGKSGYGRVGPLTRATLNALILQRAGP